MKTYSIVLLVSYFLISANFIFSQDCNSQDWTKVELRTVTQKNAPDIYLQREEGAVITNLHGPINRVLDLNEKEIEEIKKTAKKYNCYIVYIDLNNIFGFDHLKSNQLYYYWVSKK